MILVGAGPHGREGSNRVGRVLNQPRNHCLSPKANVLTFGPMKAAVLHGREDVRVEDLPNPAPQAGEVRVAIEAALTCGTDLKVFKRGYHARMIVPPAVFGHEFAGRIDAVGQGVTDWQVGDRVVAANSAPCGECDFCRRAQENLCDHLNFLNGAYAESIIIPRRLVQKNLLRLKPETSFADAALVEPLACVELGLADLRLQASDRLLVLGCGPIGLMFVALARAAGCLVTAAGRGETRLATARRLGARQVIEVGGPHDLIPTVIAAAEGPFDAVVEAIGQPMSWEAAVKLVRKGGKVNFFGGCATGATVTLETSLLHYSNLTLLATFHHTPQTVRRALEHIESGLIRAADFVNGECALDGLPALFHSMSAGNKAVKTLIRTNGK